MLNVHDEPVKDTVGSSSIQRSVGGDGTDGQHSHADDEVGHQEHADALVESSVPHHKAWLGEKHSVSINMSINQHILQSQGRNFGPDGHNGGVE